MVLFQEEIHPCQSFAGNGFKRGNGKLLNSFLVFCGQIGRDLQLGTFFINILGFIGIKFVCGDDLPRNRSNGAGIA